MNPTISAILRNTIPPPTRDHFDGEIVAVDYRSRELVVRLEGGSTIKVRARHDMDLGTNENPKVIPGGRIQVARVDAQYVASIYLPLIGNNIGGGGRTPTPVLQTPQWSTGYPRLRGTLIEGMWNVVPSAIAYRVWRNATPLPSPNGAVLFGEFNQNQFSQQYIGASGETNLISNAGFENGTLDKWRFSGNPGYAMATAQTTTKRSGSYALRLDSTYVAMIARVDYTDHIPVLPSTQYVLTVWYRMADAVQQGMLGIGSMAFQSNLTTNSPDETTITTETITWTQAVLTFTTDANQYFTRPYIEIQLASGAGPYVVYIDDMTLVGPTPGNASDFFAVQAIDANGNASGFSSWLQPIQQSAQMGARTPTAPTVIQESGSFTNSAGVRVTDYGINDTGWQPLVVPLVPSNAVYVSSSSCKFDDIDLTGLFTAGVKVRFKQSGGYKKFIVVSSAYASGDTTLTLTGPSGDTVANATITDFYYSYAQDPQGWALFPNDATKSLRGDGTYGVQSGGLSVIEDKLLVATATSFDFQNIPATYRQLRLELAVKADKASDSNTVSLRFNNDSGSNYSSLRIMWYEDSNHITDESISATSGLLFRTVNAILSTLTLTIPNYAGTSLIKGYHFDGVDNYALVSQGIRPISGGGAWNSTAAISRITLTIGANNFAAGSRATLYGLA